MPVLAFDSEFGVGRASIDCCVLEKARLFVVLDCYRFVLVLRGLNCALELLEAVALELLGSVELGVVYRLHVREVKHVVLGCIRDRFWAANVLLVDAKHHLTVVALSRALLRHLLHPFCLTDSVDAELWLLLGRGVSALC